MGVKMKKNLLRKIITSVFFIFCFSQCYSDTLTNDKKLQSYKYMKTINSVFDFVQQNYVEEIDPKILYEGALKGMLNAIGDPYTLYLDADAMRDLTDTTEGTFGGLGIYITKPLESTPAKPAYVEISSPMEDTPASRAGLQSGDFIIAINGEPTPDMTSDDVLERLRGPVGTSVTITILRGKNIKFDINLTRALIEVPTIKYSMIEGTSTGYVRIIQFTPETAKRLQDALDSFEKSNYNSLIIDVRDNPGGLMVSAVEVADKFIDEGTIVDVKSRLLFENQKFSAKKENTTVKKGIPIVMLINNGAASASEILAGALKDSHLAYLVGEKTYGKGSVQQVVPLSNTEGIKITMARYYSPSDTNIDKIGIPADLEVKNIEIKPEEEQTYTDLYNSGILPEIATENPNMTEKEIAEKAKELAKIYPIEERLLRRLIRVQLPNSASIVYDLDYDNQLQAALDVLNTKDFDSLLKSTKSLKELQEEAKQKDENGKVVATK